jgi:prepilin-type N-terminal cleavage/methylation domain-containing protein
MRMNNHGHTLMEIMVSTAILSIVSLLGFVVLQSSTSSAQLANAKVDVQNNLRDTMAVLTAELREGVTQTTTEKTGAPEDLFPVAVSDEGRAITFQMPEPIVGEAMFAYSTPITFSLQNEDENGNGLLDPDEDTNEDGVLTRRIVRSQVGETLPVASASTIDFVNFTLLANQVTGVADLTTVQITLRGSKRYGAGEGKPVLAEMTSNIRLVN